MRINTKNESINSAMTALLGALVLGMMLFSQPVLAASVIASDAKVKMPGKDSIEVPGYVTLENTTDQEIIVIRIRSSAFNRSMISQTIKDNDQLRDLLRADLVLKPNSRIVMKNDGTHLLFAGPKQKMVVGKSITANLYLNNSEKIPVEFKIVK